MKLRIFDKLKYVNYGPVDKYVGKVAEEYNAKRVDNPKWSVEQKVIERFLSDLPRDTIVFDCPVGTGRFIPYYNEKGFIFMGMDISTDMLEQAVKNVVKDVSRGSLKVGNVIRTDLADKCVDVSVNCRITRWLSPEDNQNMLREMQRITKKRIIWTARVANHPHARSVELFEAALDGWKITRNEAGYETDYRILMAEPV